MKKVKFLKKHGNYSKDQTVEIEITQGLLNYWVRCGVCEDLGESKPKDRKAELMSLNRDELNIEGSKVGIDSLSFKTKGLLADAIIVEENK